jgi:hypothetical protein
MSHLFLSRNIEGGNARTGARRRSSRRASRPSTGAPGRGSSTRRRCERMIRARARKPRRLRREVLIAHGGGARGRLPGNSGRSCRCWRRPRARRTPTSWGGALRGAAAVASFLAAVLAEIDLCNVCSCQEMLRRHGRGQGGEAATRAALLGALDADQAAGALGCGGGRRRRRRRRRRGSDTAVRHGRGARLRAR